jgi:hypothetical protein
MSGELSTRQLIGAVIVAATAGFLVYFGSLYVVDHWITPRDTNDPLVKQRGLKLEQAPALAK